ncbi:MAG: putative RNA methyltransferase [Anaerorhabdus sp.]
MQLYCPICQSELFKKEKSFQCANKHLFDQSKHGYLNLYVKNSSKSPGDDKIMVQARSSFLAKGYYDHLKTAVNDIIRDINPYNLVDLACGEGYYTKDFPCLDVVGVDLSKDAIIFASKQDKKTQYLIASIFTLPLASSSTSLVTTLFAPVALKEIERILIPGGYFLLVSVGEDHLYELKKFIYDIPYKNDELHVDTSLTIIKQVQLKQSITIQSYADIQDLFMMTPYYYKTSPQDKSKLDLLDQMELVVHFTITLYKK